MKTGIITDSSFYVSEETLEQYQITQVGLSLNFEDETFVELDPTRDIDSLVSARIKRDKVLPTTSQPTPYQFQEAFESKIAAGFEKIIFFAISSKLSGTYQNAVNSAKQYMEENPGVEIEVYDTQQFCSAGITLVLEVAKRLESGISAKEIHDLIDFYSSKSHLYFVVNDLTNLSYGGRISPNVAKFSNFIGLKPILCCKDGMIEPYSKARSKKAALKKMIDELRDNLEEGKSYYVGITHCEAAEDAQLLLDNVLTVMTGYDVEVLDTVRLGSALSIHSGEGAVLLHYTEKSNF